MSTLQERLEQLLNGPPKIKAADLARACGIKQPSVNGWLSGKTKKLEASNALAAAEFFGVSAWWLATGEGPMRPRSGSTNPHVPHRTTVSAQSPTWPFSSNYSAYEGMPIEKKEELDRIVSAFLTGAAPIKRKTGTR